MNLALLGRLQFIMKCRVHLAASLDGNKRQRGQWDEIENIKTTSPDELSRRLLFFFNIP